MRTCNGDTVIRGCPATKFIHEYERMARRVPQNNSCLVHLYHKSRLASHDIVASAHPCKNAIGWRNSAHVCVGDSTGESRSQ